jgi:hypothetical protein
LEKKKRVTKIHNPISESYGALPDFSENARQGERTFQKLSGNVIGLFENSSQKLSDF